MTETAIQRPGANLRSISQASSAVAGSRLREIDIWRGVVIVLMALDHARDFFHSGAFLFNPLDPERTNAALYATRWITHLCAPSFIFLGGVSAYLQAVKGKPTAQLSRFLLTRGLWLVAIEVTLVSFSWAYALPYPLLLQVIWAIGWSMMALSLLIWLPRVAVLAVGIAIVAGHNLLDSFTPGQFGNLAIVWTFLHEGGRLAIGGQPIGLVSYPVLPWAGVMAVGYGLGTLFLAPAQQRDRMVLILGGAMIALFLLLRGLNLYGDPDAWTPQRDLARSAMAFLDVQKYPPSLMYVLVTLGLGFMLVPLLSRLQGRGGGILLTYGAVPFFFYVLHLPLIHGLAIAANAALGRDVSGMFNFFVNMAVTPERHLHLGFPLPGVYVAWIVVLALLYPLCRWWMKLKQRRNDWWLSYL